MHSDDFNFVYIEGRLYVGGESNDQGNCAYNKNIVNAYLPSYYDNTLIYGTRSSCLENISTLKFVFIPRTYRSIGTDLCVYSNNVEAIVFEENSQVTHIRRWLAACTSITQIALPSSLKTITTKKVFGNEKSFW